MGIKSRAYTAITNAVLRSLEREAFGTVVDLKPGANSIGPALNDTPAIYTFNTMNN
jgi:hypothetical protein